MGLVEHLGRLSTYEPKLKVVVGYFYPHTTCLELADSREKNGWVDNVLASIEGHMSAIYSNQPGPWSVNMKIHIVVPVISGNQIKA